MKKISALALFAATGAFAFDYTLPVAKGTLEGDVMFGRNAGTGYYDDDGENQDISGSPAVMTPALQVKYGIMDGLDVSLQLDYEMRNEDAGDVSGIDRPDLGVKYVVPDLGVGGFLNVSLPFGSEDIAGDEPATTIFGGVLYGKTFDKIEVNAAAGYAFNTEDGAKEKQDEIDIYAQGQYNVNEMVGPYLGIGFDKTLEKQVDGNGVDKSSGYLLTLKPGANVTLNDKMACELSVPVTVMGANNPAAWGIAAGFYYSIGL